MVFILVIIIALVVAIAVAVAGVPVAGGAGTGRGGGQEAAVTATVAVAVAVAHRCGGGWRFAGRRLRLAGLSSARCVACPPHPLRTPEHCIPPQQYPSLPYLERRLLKRTEGFGWRFGGPCGNLPKQGDPKLSHPNTAILIIGTPPNGTPHHRYPETEV